LIENKSTIGAAMNESETNAVLKLPRTLDFGAAEGFLEMMRSRLQDNARLRVDASGVEVLTVPCIQIILSALQTYDEMSIERPSRSTSMHFKIWESIAANHTPARSPRKRRRTFPPMPFPTPLCRRKNLP
jgi:hypothetical protein